MPVVPPDLQTALDANPNAKAFFETHRGANRYGVVCRRQEAKAAKTHRVRIEKFIGMLKRNDVVHRRRHRSAVRHLHCRP